MDEATWVNAPDRLPLCPECGGSCVTPTGEECPRCDGYGLAGVFMTDEDDE